MSEDSLVSVFKVILVLVVFVLWLVASYVALVLNGVLCSIVVSGIMAFVIGRRWDYMMNDW